MGCWRQGSPFVSRVGGAWRWVDLKDSDSSGGGPRFEFQPCAQDKSHHLSEPLFPCWLLRLTAQQPGHQEVEARAGCTRAGLRSQARLSEEGTWETSRGCLGNSHGQHMDGPGGRWSQTRRANTDSFTYTWDREKVNTQVSGEQNGGGMAGGRGDTVVKGPSFRSAGSNGQCADCISNTVLHPRMAQGMNLSPWDL